MASKTEFLGYLPQGTQMFEYTIERVLGHGGFGVTYLAQDTLLDKPVAIKEYLPTDLAMRAGLPQVVLRSPDLREAFIWGREQFLKEARTLARFTHPNLITVHRFFEAHDTAYFVMEYAQGQTLAQVLKREVTLPDERLRAVLMPVLAGLAQVHRAGVLHRDIKPDNIMLRGDDSPVLIDFGAARLTLGSKTRSILSVLTAGYAPLEQYGTAGSNQGPWTDIYALGAVTYRAIAGKKPVDAVNRVHADPLAPASVVGRGRYPEPFLAAVDWALCVVPEHRPRSIEEWRAALDGHAPVPPQVQSTLAAAAQVQAGNGTPPSTWQQVAESAAREYAEFAGDVPQSHADSPSAPERTPSRSLTMSPAAAPSRQMTWIATLVMLALVLALVESVVRREEPASPAAGDYAPPVEAALPPARNLDERLATRLSLPPAPAAATPASTEAAPASTEAALRKVDKPSRAKAAARATPVTALTAGSKFQDCPDCPEMSVLDAGAYMMGAPLDPSTNSWERPAHPVKLRRFAIAFKETTAAQWKACVAKGGCPAQKVGREASFPAIDVSWNDAQAYVQWLSGISGRTYRLPSEAEWEYAARGGSTASRFWGEDRELQCQHANGADQSARDVVEKGLRVAGCDDRFPRLAPVGSFLPNGFGLFDVSGNVWEWTQDCWHDSFLDAPQDGRAIDAADCPTRVIRGGSWRGKPESLRNFSRGLSTTDHRGDDLGFRVAAD